jgi:membrane-associated phospholipid phosphatase
MDHRARRWLPPVVLTFSLFLCVGARTASGQDNDPAAPPDSTQNVPAGQQGSAQSDRTVTVRKLPGNILEDQEEIFLFPKDLAKGKHWWPTVGVLGGTVALVASDPYTAPAFRTTTRFNGFNRGFSAGNTAAFIAAVPAVMYGVGWLRKDSYAKETALFAGEAVVDGFLLDIPLKGVTGRKQPLNYSGNGPYSDSFFNGSHNPINSGGFYSVHAFAATAVATVIARRYRKHRWVPFVAYGLAGAICFSRISRSEHFPSDVFLGAAMGFVISRYTVLPARD